MPRAMIYISEFQNKLAWKFDISVSPYPENATVSVDEAEGVARGGRGGREGQTA